MFAVAASISFCNYSTLAIKVRSSSIASLLISDSRAAMRGLAALAQAS